MTSLHHGRLQPRDTNHMALHGTLTIVDNRIEWCDDNSILMACSTGILIKDITTRSITSISLPFGYIATSWCCSSRLNHIAIAMNGPKCVIHIYHSRTLELLTSYDMPGGVDVIINSSSFTSDGLYLIACTSRPAQLHVISIGSIKSNVAFDDTSSASSLSTHSNDMHIIATRSCFADVRNIHMNMFNPLNTSGIQSYECCVYGAKQASLYQIYFISSLQPPIIRCQSVDFLSQQFNTFINHACWLQATAVLFALSSGELMVVDARESNETVESLSNDIDMPNKSRITQYSSQHSLSSTYNEASLPVTKQELGSLGIENSQNNDDTHIPVEDENASISIKARLMSTQLPSMMSLNTNIDTRTHQLNSPIADDKPPTILSLARTKQHLMVGTSDGCIMWLNPYTLAVQLYLCVDVTNASSIDLLSFNPSFHSFIQLSHDGAFRLLRHVTEQTRALMGDGPEPVHPVSFDVQDRTISSVLSPTDAAQSPLPEDSPSHPHHLTRNHSLTAGSSSVPMFQILSLGHYLRAFHRHGTSHRRARYGCCVVPDLEHTRDDRNVRLLTYSSNGTVHVWSAHSKILLASFTFESSLNCVCASPDGQLALCGLASGVLAILDLTQSNCLRLIYAQRLHSSPILHIAYSSSGDRFASLSVSQMFFVRAFDLKVLGYVPVFYICNKRDASDDAKQRERDRLKQQAEDQEFFASLISQTEVHNRQPNLDSSSRTRETEPVRSHDLPTTFTWLPSDSTSGQERIVISTSSARVLVLEAPVTSIVPPDYEPDANELLLDEIMIQPTFSKVESPLLSLVRSPDPDHFYATNQAKQLCLIHVKDDQVVVLSTFDGHYKSAQALCISPSGSLIVTAGRDGLVIVRARSNPSQILAKTIAGSYLHGGLYTVSVNEQGPPFVVSAGFDGSVARWDLSSVARAIISKSPPATPPVAAFTIARKVLDNLPDLEEPALDSPTFLSQFAPTASPSLPSVMREQKAELVGLLDRLKQSVGSVRERNTRLTDGNQLAWFDTCVDVTKRDALVQESKQRVKEREAAMQAKQLAMEQQCSTIRDTCWDSMSVKAAVIKASTPGSQAELHNFPVKNQSSASVKQIKQMHFLRSMELAERAWRFAESDRIDREHAERAHHHRGSSEDPSYSPVSSLTDDDGLPWDRHAELWVHDYCSNVEYIVNADELQHPYVSVHHDDDAGLSLAAAVSRDASRATTAAPPSTASAAPPTAKTTKTPSTSITLVFPSLHSSHPHPLTVTLSLPPFLLYHPLDVFTPARKRVQHALISLKALSLQLNFNTNFNDFAQTKAKDLATIAEKQKRMNEIALELKELSSIPIASQVNAASTANLLVQPIELRPEENSSHLFTVTDAELSEHAQRQRKGSSVSANVNLSGDASKQAQFEKALELFMNNTLDSKKHWASTFAELVAAKPAYHPASATTTTAVVNDISSLNEEQKAECAKFDKRLKLFEQELDNRKKTLMVEYGKFKTEIADLCKAFDSKLSKMKDTRFTTTHEILIQEWQMARILKSLYLSLSSKHKKHVVFEHARILAALAQQLRQRIVRIKHELDDQTRQHEANSSECKNLDKTLKKEILDLGENYDHLCKLFRIKNAKVDTHGGNGGGQQQSKHGHPARAPSIGGNGRQRMSMAGFRARGRQSMVSVDNLNQMLASTHHKQASLFGIEGLTGAGLGLSGPGGAHNKSHHHNKRRSAMGGQDEQQIQLNPYPTLASTESPNLVLSDDPADALAGYMPLHWSFDLEICPPDLNPATWARFVDRRKLIVGLEHECQYRLQALTQWNRYCLRLQTVHHHVESHTRKLIHDFHLSENASDSDHHEEDVSSRSDWIAELLSMTDNAQFDRETFNTSFMLRIQQGQVELPQDSGLASFMDICLVDRSVIERLNASIKELGAEKMSVVRSQFEFNAWLRFQEWTREMLQVEFERQVDLTTQLQLLRVTKQMQIKIKEREQSSYAGKGAVPTPVSSSVMSDDGEVMLIERQMESIRSNARDFNASQQAALTKVATRKAKLLQENERLRVHLNRLLSAVSDRSAIDKLREEGEMERKDIEQRRMKDVVTRRKLVDLAELQTQEMTWLRKQVDILRKRTFASFAESQYNPHNKLRPFDEEKTQMR